MKRSALYSVLLENYPNNSLARFHLGQCYKMMGKRGEAIAEFRATAKDKRAAESLIEQACDQVEELSCPPLTPLQVGETHQSH